MSPSTRSGRQEAGEGALLLRTNSATQDDRSSTTLSGAESGDEEELIDSDKSNQHVGRGRGILISLSVWALIFLQGLE